MVAGGKGGTRKSIVATYLACIVYGVINSDCDVEEPIGHIFLMSNIKRLAPVFVSVCVKVLSMCNCNIEKMLSKRDALLIREYNAALDLARFDVRDTILDIATGSGRMLLQVLTRGHSVISGDIDPEALNRAKGHLGDLVDKPTLVVMDAHKLQFADNSFQAVTFANAIHEIDDPRGVLDEIARVLTDDGKLLVVEFNSRGFELMEICHRIQSKGEHRKGEMTSEDIDSYLQLLFGHVETRESDITRAWIASGKR